MNKSHVLKWLEDQIDYCACGETRFHPLYLEYTSDLRGWLEGKKIYYWGFVGCCPDPVEDEE